MGDIISGGTSGIYPVPVPVAPADLDVGRVERKIKYRTPEGRIRTISMYDKYSPDDVIGNQGRACFYAVFNSKPYDRPPTPWKLKRTLSRVGLVF